MAKTSTKKPSPIKTIKPAIVGGRPNDRQPK